MKHPLLAFLPSPKIAIGFVLLNLLVIGGITGGLFYRNNLSNLDTTQTIPNDDNFISYQNNLYWLSIHSKSSEAIENPDVGIYQQYTKTYSISIRSGDTIRSIPFFKYIEPDNGSVNHIGFTYTQIKLLSVVDGMIFIKLTDHVDKPLNASTHEVEELHYHYLGVITLSDSLTQLKSFHLFRQNSTQDVIRDLRGYQDRLLLLLEPYYNGSIFTYLKSPDLADGIITSSLLKTTLEQQISTGGTSSIFDAGLREDREPVDFSSIVTDLNITNILQQEYGNPVPIFRITELKKSTIKLIDDTGTIHLTGEQPNYDDKNYREAYRVDGTTDNSSIMFNRPDYLAINPSTGQSQYWDIIPFWYDQPNLQLAQLGQGQVIATLNEVNMTDLYTGHDTYQGFDTKFYLQYFVFNPFEFGLKNFIQLNKDISQTEQSTVRFPRPVDITIVHQISLYGSNVKLTAITTADGLKAFISERIFVTKAGLSSFLDGPDGGFSSSRGGSLVVHTISFDTNFGNSYMGWTKISGPTKRLESNYTEKQWDKERLYGINIDTFYSIQINPAQTELIFIYAGGVNAFTSWPLVFETVPITEVLP